MREDDSKRRLIDTADFAGHGQFPHDLHAARHHLQRQIGDRPIYADDVFFLVIVFRTQDLVDDVAVVGQQDQALGILVQPANGEYPLGMADQVDDIAVDMRLCRAGDSHRFIESDVNLRLLNADDLAVDANLILRADSRAEERTVPIASDASGFDPLVRLAPGTHAGFADVFVESQARNALI